MKTKRRNKEKDEGFIPFFILSFLLVTAIFNNSRTFDNVGALFETEIRKFETLVELNPTDDKSVKRKSGCKKKRGETRSLQLFSRLIKTSLQSERLLHCFFLLPVSRRVHLLPAEYFLFPSNT